MSRWMAVSVIVIGLTAPAALVQTVSYAPPQVVISALFADGYADDDADDAVQLTNVGRAPVELRGWSVRTRYAAVVFPEARLPPGGSIWVARSQREFIDAFGFQPDWVMDRSNPLARSLGGTALRFDAAGGQVSLWDAHGQLVDALVYAAGNTAIDGWSGPAVVPYTPTSTFAGRGQIIYRKLHPASGLPVADTDTGADWAQDPDDPVLGRRARYPGWDLHAFFHPPRVTATATLTVALAPDNLFSAVHSQIEAARDSIIFYGYTLEHPRIARSLAERAATGVAVTVLLEDGPAAGIAWAEMWAAREIEAAGGRVYLMINRPDVGIYDRYRSYHAKVFVIDSRIVMVGSENPGLGGMPSDDPSDDMGDYPGGHRGAYLIVDAPSVADAVNGVLRRDLAPNHHRDVVRWPTGAPPYMPPEWYEPPGVSEDGGRYPIRWPEPLVVHGAFEFEVVTAPENALNPAAGLLGLIARAGEADTIYVQQLAEPPHWGAADGTPATDQNLRLEAYLDAARRGAHVRIMVDSYFDDPDLPDNNAATVAYVRQIASTEALNLRAISSNVTGLGVHNKMVLAHIGGRGYVHIGSLNGSEVASKLNREVALQVQSDAAFAYLAQVFQLDWALADLPVRLPFVARD